MTFYTYFRFNLHTTQRFIPEEHNNIVQLISSKSNPFWISVSGVLYNRPVRSNEIWPPDEWLIFWPIQRHIQINRITKTAFQRPESWTGVTACFPSNDRCQYFCIVIHICSVAALKRNCIRLSIQNKVAIQKISMCGVSMNLKSAEIHTFIFNK